MHTTVILVRAGETEWTKTGKLLGRRDVALSEAGREQARRVADLLGSLDIGEVLSSPLLRATETAEMIAVRHGIELARDPRLAELNFGAWEGKTVAELAGDEEYRAFLKSPTERSPPRGESLGAMRDRLLASMDQALEDNQIGANIVLVTHHFAVQALLAHCLGMDLAHHQRLTASPGSVSVLRFESDREPPRVLAINRGDPLASLLT